MGQGFGSMSSNGTPTPNLTTKMNMDVLRKWDRHTYLKCESELHDLRTFLEHGCEDCEAYMEHLRQHFLLHKNSKNSTQIEPRGFLPPTISNSRRSSGGIGNVLPAWSWDTYEKSQVPLDNLYEIFGECGHACSHCSFFIRQLRHHLTHHFEGKVPEPRQDIDDSQHCSSEDVHTSELSSLTPTTANESEPERIDNTDKDSNEANLNLSAEVTSPDDDLDLDPSDVTNGLFGQQVRNQNTTDEFVESVRCENEARPRSWTRSMTRNSCSGRTPKLTHLKNKTPRPDNSKISKIANGRIVKPKRTPKTSTKSKTLEDLRREGKNIFWGESRIKLYKCFECHEILKRTEEREAHMKSAHPNIPAPYKCDECSKDFYQSHGLFIHKRTTHLAAKLYACQYADCVEKFHSKVTLSTHEKTHPISQDKPAYSCRFCSKGFPTMLQLEKHERQAAHTEERSFICSHPLCSKGFQKKRYLDIHLKTHSGTREVSLCQECGKSYSSKAAARRHEKTHNPPFPCDVCDKSYTTEILLDDHKNSIHTRKRPYECPTNGCNQSFSRQTDLRTHKRNIHGLPVEGTHKCHCGKIFMLSAQLINHKRTHVGKKPFSCDKCGKTFTQKCHLAHHKKTLHGDVARETYKHSGVKDFSCLYCPNKFVSLEALRHHEERTHLFQELPFTCTTCKKGFQRSYFLEVHERIHNGEKPFKCTKCRKKFRSKETLGIHLKKTHRNDTDSEESCVDEMSYTDEF